VRLDWLRHVARSNAGGFEKGDRNNISYPEIVLWRRKQPDPAQTTPPVESEDTVLAAIAALRDEVDELRAVTAEEAAQVRARLARLEQDVARFVTAAPSAGPSSSNAKVAKHAAKIRAERARKLSSTADPKSRKKKQAQKKVQRPD
jgi:hypothetical protein